MSRRPPMALERYADFCAPHVVAALFDVTRLEAAEYLTAIGANVGDGGTDFDILYRLLTDLLGEALDPRDSNETAFNDAWDRYQRGLSWSRPQGALRRPTVAQLPKYHPETGEGTWVVWTTTHILMTKDGKTFVDSYRNSRRMRVRYAWKVEG